MSSHLAHPRYLPCALTLSLNPSTARLEYNLYVIMGLVSINDLEIPTLYAVLFVLFRTLLHICAAQIEYPK